MPRTWKLIAVLTTIVGFPVGVWAASPNARAPFRVGEVVVAGAPADLPQDAEVIKYLPYANLTVVAVEPGKEWGQVQRLRATGRRAGLNHLARASLVPNDPYHSLQWHLSAVQAEAAWDVTNGTGVIVAVLDTGLAPGGQDQLGCVNGPYDAIDGDTDPVDGDGHGTHVAGTVAQATNNTIGVAGLAFGACVMPVKVLDDTGVGTFADIAEGIQYAVDNGAHVINMSLSTNARFKLKNDPVVDPVLDQAYMKDVTVVCAAGNDGSRANVGYPAVAPGGDSTKDLNGDGYMDGVLQETHQSGEWGYWFFTGTSMASPHVAAVAAMLIANGTATTPDAVYQAVTSSALDLGTTGYDKNYGYGLVQAYDALRFDASACSDVDQDDWCVEEGDCNDNDATVNPSAAEVCGDGIDNNCDGNTDEGCEAGGSCTDADGDGWCVEDGDCDDSNAHVYPGHPDKGGRWGRDGLDNDCNGVDDS
jgi:serine protease